LSSDETALKGTYDLKLEWTDELSSTRRFENSSASGWNDHDACRHRGRHQHSRDADAD
jgi:hypothetical protein